MNPPITRLFWLIVVLFGLLVYFTSKSTVFQADALRNNPKNARGLLQAQKVARGQIQAADGSVLARSVKDKDGDYVRGYPSTVFSQTVGYSYLTPGRAGLERQYNDALTGQRGEFNSIIDQISGTKPKGDDLITNLNPAAQQVALDGLAGRKGAVIAMNPRTGQVQVMASVPGFDPNVLKTKEGTNALNNAPGSPLVNRVTQGLYPPGSTFKVVTAIAAIDSGMYTPDSMISGKSPLKVSGVPLNNDDNESYGDITLTEALTNSVNTVFARIALKLGAGTMEKYMKRLGFGSDPPLDYPSEQMLPSGEYVNRGRTLVSPTDGRVDLGRLAIGQDKLLATPMQMAMVASAVGNGGVLMKPRLGSKVVDADGRIRETIGPEEQTRVMSAKSAREVGQMMTKVVEEGTGQAAQLGDLAGEVAGKTGTAQIDIPNQITQPWFIAFAPVDNPRIAVAVTVERTEGGFGGTVAAPIAKNVMETLLR